MKSNHPPLRLPLVKVRIGRLQVCLLTSVLEPKHLPTQQLLQLYKMRWGIEVEFRGLKQTLERANLRSRNDQRLLVELDWSIMAMAIVELFALKEQLAQPSCRHRRRPGAAILAVQPAPGGNSIGRILAAEAELSARQSVPAGLVISGMDWRFSSARGPGSGEVVAAT